MDLEKVGEGVARRRRIVLPAVSLCFFALATAVADSERPRTSASREHDLPSGAFSFRAPVDWTIDRSLSRPEMFEAHGDGMVVRFLYHGGEIGFDTLHVSCMDDRLGNVMDADPRIHYEYDFQEGVLGDRRILDSAFKTRYDKPVLGHKEWRQRNVTYVGGGHSLCIIAFCPTSMWKKSGDARRTLESVVNSVSVR